jgi:alkylhydroperoxidase family enzyme
LPPRDLITDYAQWQQAFQHAARRSSRLPLAKSGSENTELARLLSQFPVAGQQWLEQARLAQSVGVLPLQLREQVAYVAARADQAWYMQHRARQSLLKRGMSDIEIFHLAAVAMPGASPSAAHPSLSPSTVLALRFAFKLTAYPQTICDNDIAELLKVYNPNQVAELVYQIGLAAFLDRVTEAAGLGWQQESE